LNGSRDELAWNGSKRQDTKTNALILELQYELGILARLNGGVVIHPGCYTDRIVGLKTIATTINKIDFPHNSTLILENCAGEGSKLCKNIQEFKIVLEAIDPDKQCHVKICIDTAHIWGQGDYDLRLIFEIDRLFDDIQSIIGIDKLALIHLNDSAVELGTKKDRHACIGTGYIWGKNVDALKHLLVRCKTCNIPIVLETYESDVEITLQLIS
jgi:deoxyribonuclease-4